MARNCICCGKPYEGRIDKKFCCDDCRTDYHNQIRRERDRRFRTVNHILASNWKILSAALREGRNKLSVAELADRNFNFEVYTNTRRLVPGRRTYWCYDCAYRVSRSGMVHIWEGGSQNNAYL